MSPSKVQDAKLYCSHENTDLGAAHHPASPPPENLKHVLLILPAYNEEDSILQTVEKIHNFSKKISTNQMGFTLDLMVINDCSTDKTKQLLLEHHIPAIHLMQNLGIGGGVQTGYKYARLKGYDIAVQFDGDGQHDIASLPNLLQPLLKEEADFVIGSRFLDGSSQFQSTLSRRMGIRLLSLIIRLCTGKRVADPTSGYRAAGRGVLHYFSQYYPVDYPEPESIVALIREGFRFTEVQANMFARQGGKSSIFALKSIYYIIRFLWQSCVQA